MTREDLELYAMGAYEGDVAALERELADDPAARAVVAEEARLELLLREAAAVATFCAACDDLVRGPRCEACGAAVRPGGYVVERVIVSNAHGRMYAARDADGKQVALKELAFVQSPTLEVIAAFEREVKFLRALDHPAIPRFCASFEEGSGVHVRYYLAQELVAGESLASRLEAHWYTEAEIAGIARQVLDVLVYLQGLSPMVIHRDIKPANLVVRGDGTIALVDFGAAHVQGMTAGSTTIGTFGYMPIEQLAGEVDATTDPYALGASLLHLLTRKEPWRILHGGTLAGLELNVSRPMRAFLTRLVAPQPRDRFRSAADARAALDRVTTRRAGLAGRRPVRAALQRLPRAATVVAALMVALAGAGGVVFWVHHGPRAVRRQNSAIVSRLAEFRDMACQCIDRPCVDRVNEAMTRWTHELAKWPGASRMNPEATKQVTAISEELTRCLTRALTANLPGSAKISAADPVVADPVPADPVRADPVPADPVPADPAPKRDVFVRFVQFPAGPISIHTAALVIARSCRLNVVVPGQINGMMEPPPSVMTCTDALDAVARVRPGRYDQLPGDIFRLADVNDDMLPEHAARANDGIVEASLPDGDSVDLDFERTSVRTVLQRIARAGGVNVTISEGLEGSDATVTVRMHRVPWHHALGAVVEASGLHYRYREQGKRLRVAPIQELELDPEGTVPHGFLRVRHRGPGQVRIEIDGVETKMPAEGPLSVPAGKHRVRIKKVSAGNVVRYIEHVVDIEPGKDVTLHD